MTTTQPKQKALCVATRCTTVEQFVATFHRFCDESSFFVATMATRPVGLETAFSIQLEDKTPVLRGLCTVVEAWSTPANRYGRPGVRLSVKRLTNESLPVFKQLQAARKTTEAAEAKPIPPPVAVPAPPPPIPLVPPLAPLPPRPRLATPPPIRIPSITPIASPVVAPAIPEPPPGPEPAPSSPPGPFDVPEPIAASDDLTNPVAVETRTPGSSYILPANPLMNLTDQSLQGFVDCALYEETGNFFRAPGDDESLVDIDDVAAPPPSRSQPRTLTPIPAIRSGGLSPTAFVPPDPRDEQFAPEATPLPFLAGMSPLARAATPPPVPPTPPAGRAPTPPVFDDSDEMFSSRGHPSTAPPMRPPPTSPPYAVPSGGVMSSMTTGAAPPPPMYPAPDPYPVAPQPLPPAGPMPMAPSYGMAPIDSTANLIAINQKRERKRWLVIGGTAVATSLLLLVIVLASGGHGGNKEADAATPQPTRSTPPPEKPALVAPTKPAVETAPPVKPLADPPEDTATDPNAPPVVGTGPCRVTVTSSPAGSIVSLDDQAFGPSPISIDGPCARRRVDAKHPRYAIGTRWVTLAPGKPATVDLSLARPTHSVTITSVPSGATVSIAGKRAGTTPTAVKVMGFTGVTLTVEKKGFRTVSEKLYSKVENDKLTVKLDRGK